MDAVSFDALTRRASLVSAGAAGFTVLTNPIATEGKKRKKRKKGDVNKLCKGQEDNCLTLLLADCDGDAQCLVEVPPCCELIARCDVTGFLTCIVAISEE